MANGKTATLTRMEQQSTQGAPTRGMGTTQEVTTPRGAPPTVTPTALQQHVLEGGSGEDAILVQLILSGGDADGVRWYTERLPLSVVRGLLDPDVDDFFLPIEGSGRSKLPGSKTHYLHTSAIREIILLAPLPAVAEI